MAPIGVIVFFSLFIFILFGAFGYYLYKEEKLKGILLMSIGIGLALGLLLWGVKKSNCMNGSKQYGKKSMTYSNGKVHYYTPRSNRAIYCEDHEGLGVGYVFKASILWFIISFGSLYGIDKLKEYNNKKNSNNKKKSK